MIADLVDEPLVAEGVLADEGAQVDDEVAVVEGTGADDLYAEDLPHIKRPGRSFLPACFKLSCNNNMYDKRDYSYLNILTTYDFYSISISMWMH